jgi:hypothetical protein
LKVLDGQEIQQHRCPAETTAQEQPDFIFGPQLEPRCRDGAGDHADAKPDEGDLRPGQMTGHFFGEDRHHREEKRCEDQQRRCRRERADCSLVRQDGLLMLHARWTSRVIARPAEVSGSRSLPRAAG